MKSVQLHIKYGFTLIELLIVIAIIGVLATVVLAAINPVEQLARGRDTGRITAVTQYGHAWQNYVTNLGTGTYPGTAASWETTLKTSGEISTAIAYSTANVVAACPASSLDTSGYMCYSNYTNANVGAGTNNAALIYTAVESSTNKGKANCTSPAIAVFMYDSAQGKAGYTCVPNANGLITSQPTLK